MKSKTNKEIQWPADAVERRAVDSLVPYARNARTHSDAQVAQIAKSIEDYGFTVPVLVDDAGNVIAGHGRILAAKALGIADIPVMVARGWSAAKRRSYVILDNKLALNSGWDTDILRLELADLAAEGISGETLGFEAGELSSILDPVAPGQSGAGSLAEKFGVPPFSILNAREGWWQDRKRAWIALGIQSELGRGAPIGGGADASGSQRGGLTWGDAPQVTEKGLNYYRKRQQRPAAPGGSLMPAADYSKRQRGNGKGQAIG